MKMIFYFLMKSAELCKIQEDPLDIEVALLKRLICQNHGIQVDNVILIANGGQCIQDGVLSNYYCGDHENNPIFVYLRQQNRPPIPVVAESPLFKDFYQIIERLTIVGKKLVVGMVGLKENESMSLSVFESGRKVKQLIDSSVQDQFLLVEGWNAAVANLCDSLQSIEKRIMAMKENLKRFLDRDLEDGFSMMDQYEARKQELEKVPMLQCLVKDGYHDGELPVNLLQWVLYRDKGAIPRVTVQSIVTEAHEAYRTLMGVVDDDSVTLDTMRAEWGRCGMVTDVIKSIGDGEELVEKCKPIQLQSQNDDYDEERPVVDSVSRDHYTSNKAYMERLNYLDGVRRSCDQLMGLIQTHKEYMENTVRQCRDGTNSAVMQDHCKNAKTQYHNLQKNYAQLVEWFNKVSCSKNDLVKNIDERKNWLMKYETSICKVDATLFVAKENIKRVRLGCRVLEQMGTAPKIYVQGVMEIRRRQEFVDKWYDWGLRCSKLSRDLRRKDHEQRMMLSHDLDNHFMYSLFGSLHSFSLPKIGSQLLNSSKPELPHISEDDIQMIAASLPNLTPLLEQNPMSPDIFVSMDRYQFNMFGPEDPGPSDSQQILKKPDSCASIEDVSLMPVPEDTPIQLEELCLSVQGMQLSNRQENIVVNEEEMSKMVRSIDSMEFQLTNDKTTETGRDVVCVPRTLLESLLQCTRQVRGQLDSTRVYCLQQVQEQAVVVAQTSKLLRVISDDRGSGGHRERNAESGSSDYIGGQREAPESGTSNTVMMAHREFRVGQTVCFISQTINGALQWRMVTSDGKINYLHDECISPAVATRKDSALTVPRPPLPMTQSQQSPKVSSKSTTSTSSSSNVLWSPQIVWGTFLSREEYISKKMSNRFGLPVDTKFFRVRAAIDWGSLS